MKFKASIGDSMHLPPDGYLVVRQKGQSIQHTQLLHIPDVEQHRLMDLAGRPQALFYALALRLQFDHVAKMTHDEMKSAIKVSSSKTYHALQTLKEVQLVRKVAKDTYKLDPTVVWRGRVIERKKAMEEWAQK